MRSMLPNMRRWIRVSRLSLVVILAGGALTTVTAQTPPAGSRTAVGIGEAFTAAMTPPPAIQQVKKLRLYLDSKQIAEVDAPASGDATIAVPGIATPGAHVLEASSVNDAGESPTKTRIDFWVGPPAAPTFRILQVVTTQTFEPVFTDQFGIQLRLVETRTAVSEIK